MGSALLSEHYRFRVSVRWRIRIRRANWVRQWAKTRCLEGTRGRKPHLLDIVGYCWISLDNVGYGCITLNIAGLVPGPFFGFAESGGSWGAEISFPGYSFLQCRSETRQRVIPILKLIANKALHTSGSFSLPGQISSIPITNYAGRYLIGLTAM